MKTNIEVIKEKAATIITNVKEIKEQIDEASEWDSITKVIGNIGKLNNLVMEIVLAVEVVANDAADDIEDLKSSDKLEAAVELLDDAIKLSFWLELVDAHAFRLVISVGVDYLNQQYGDDWNLDVVRDAIDEGVSLITKLNEAMASVTD